MVKKESLLGKVDAIVELVKSSKCDDRMAKAVNKASVQGLFLAEISPA